MAAALRATSNAAAAKSGTPGLVPTKGSHPRGSHPSGNG
jgi:hypothetical protein